MEISSGVDYHDETNTRRQICVIKRAAKWKLRENKDQLLMCDNIPWIIQKIDDI